MFPIPGPRPFSTSSDSKELNEARGDIAALEEEVAVLRRRLEKQAVLLRALFALLMQREGMTEAELLARFSQVEAQKANAPPKRCQRCGRAVNLRHHRCLYCEETYQVESAFDLLEMGAWPNLSEQAITQGSPPAGEQGITTQRRSD
jgi:hypothetical protein